MKSRSGSAPQLTAALGPFAEEPVNYAHRVAFADHTPAIVDEDIEHAVRHAMAVDDTRPNIGAARKCRAPRGADDPRR